MSQPEAPTLEPAGTAGPFARLLAPPGWHTVDFISDLHLQAADPATARAWQQYMASTKASAVLILGDLFEVWVGDDTLTAGGFESGCAAHLKNASRHAFIGVMHGNRDFLLGPDAMRACGASLLDDPTVLSFAGQQWLLSHGDALCLDDTAYMAFRTMVREPQWQRDFLARPLTERTGVARHLRDQSDARRLSGHDPGDVDADAASAWLRAASAPVLIHGHTHRPAHHALPDGKTRVVLSDWDCAGTAPPRAEVLRLTREGLERIPLA